MGVNSTYPPLLDSGNPEGFHVVLDVDTNGTMEINITSNALVLQVGETYGRWLGNMTGSLNGGDVMNGIALYEEFKTQE